MSSWFVSPAFPVRPRRRPRDQVPDRRATCCFGRAPRPGHQQHQQQQSRGFREKMQSELCPGTRARPRCASCRRQEGTPRRSRGMRPMPGGLPSSCLVMAAGRGADVKRKMQKPKKNRGAQTNPTGDGPQDAGRCLVHPVAMRRELKSRAEGANLGTCLVMCSKLPPSFLLPPFHRPVRRKGRPNSRPARTLLALALPASNAIGPDTAEDADKPALPERVKKARELPQCCYFAL